MVHAVELDWEIKKGSEYQKLSDAAYKRGLNDAKFNRPKNLKGILPGFRCFYIAAYKKQMSGK